MSFRYQNLWNGCVGAWCPSLGSTGYALRDQSGYGNHGTLTNIDPGTRWVASGNKLALDFVTGSFNYIVLASISKTLWSYSAHVNIRAYAGSFARLFAQNGYQIEIAISSSGIVSCYDGSAWRSLSASAVPVGTWSHVGVTYDGSQLRAYINGALDGSPVTGGRAMEGISYFGNSFAPNGNDQLNGYMDDVRIYDRPLVSEMATLAQRRGIAYERLRNVSVRGAIAGGFKSYLSSRRSTSIGCGV